MPHTHSTQDLRLIARILDGGSRMTMLSPISDIPVVQRPPPAIDPQQPVSVRLSKFFASILIRTQYTLFGAKNLAIVWIEEFTAGCKRKRMFGCERNHRWDMS
ncbi:hypothetical protein EDD22DRAFT_849937 [Suillus occidentalis]|nr:hypothetical protein EDD22DRAFT_849937 [Suillus occidentalis]